MPNMVLPADSARPPEVMLKIPGVRITAHDPARTSRKLSWRSRVVAALTPFGWSRRVSTANKATRAMAMPIHRKLSRQPMAVTR